MLSRLGVAALGVGYVSMLGGMYRYAERSQEANNTRGPRLEVTVNLHFQEYLSGVRAAARAVFSDPFSSLKDRVALEPLPAGEANIFVFLMGLHGS